LASEENNLALLAAELVEVIDKNEKVFQEARQEGLNLPQLPATALDYFQEEFFQSLDETQPLNSSHNSQINADNEKIKQKKLNIKTNVYRIYNDNKKKLDDKKSDPNTNTSKSELEKLKEEAKQKINEVLTDKDNLRYTNLVTLDNGKYQNWEKDIEKLTTSDEVNAYVRAFLVALNGVGATQREDEKGGNKKNEGKSTNSNNLSNPQEPGINPIRSDTKKFSSLPLEVAKNLAKSRIRNLFNKYKPGLQKLKSL
jgi:hypothetical protein